MANSIMLQAFEWDLPADGKHWNRLKRNAEKLKRIGIDMVWLPPAYKGNGGANTVGYDVYDKYDLGEFDQKGSVRTKYGTKDEYLDLIETLHDNNVSVLADIVLNHMMGADASEMVNAIECDPGDRTTPISDSKQIEAWTSFTFPGRNGTYSNDTWNHTDFNGVDYDAIKDCNGIFLLDGKSWNKAVDWENVNYDYLMGANVDMDNPEVIKKLKKWGKWYLDTTGVDGLRLDAVKHISYDFYPEWLAAMRRHKGHKFFTVGEYWCPDSLRLKKYLDEIEDLDAPYSLFDSPLHYALFDASNKGSSYDLSKVFHSSLLKARPEHAVTFVDNHDTQPHQALESYIAPNFRQRAYALLLFQEKGLPCIFYSDLVGLVSDRHDPNAPYKPFESPEGQVQDLARMCMVRNRCAYGPQEEYDVNEHVYAYSRAGSRDNKYSGMAVLVTNDENDGASTEMYISVRYKGETFINLLNPGAFPVKLDEYGKGTFYVEKGQAAIWIRESAYKYLSSKKYFNWLSIKENDDDK